MYNNNGNSINNRIGRYSSNTNNDSVKIKWRSVSHALQKINTHSHSLSHTYTTTSLSLSLSLSHFSLPFSHIMQIFSSSFSTKTKWHELAAIVSCVSHLPGINLVTKYSKHSHSKHLNDLTIWRFRQLSLGKLTQKPT